MNELPKFPEIVLPIELTALVGFAGAVMVATLGLRVLASSPAIDLLKALLAQDYGNRKRRRGRRNRRRW